MNEILNRKIVLLRAGLTMRKIAREIGVVPQAITNEVNGRICSRRVRDGICRLTGTTYEEMWPDFHGKRKRKQHHDDTTIQL